MGFTVGGPVKRPNCSSSAIWSDIRVRSNATLRMRSCRRRSWLLPAPRRRRRFFAQYGGASTPTGQVLTRGGGLCRTSDGARRVQLAAGRPPGLRPGREALPIDAGGGDPQDDYQFVSAASTYTLPGQSQL